MIRTEIRVCDTEEGWRKFEVDREDDDDDGEGMFFGQN